MIYWDILYKKKMYSKEIWEGGPWFLSLSSGVCVLQKFKNFWSLSGRNDLFYNSSRHGQTESLEGTEWNGVCATIGDR